MLTLTSVILILFTITSNALVIRSTTIINTKYDLLLIYSKFPFVVQIQISKSVCVCLSFVCVYVCLLYRHPLPQFTPLFAGVDFLIE